MRSMNPAMTHEKWKRSRDRPEDKVTWQSNESSHLTKQGDVSRDKAIVTRDRPEKLRYKAKECFM